MTTANEKIFRIKSEQEFEQIALETFRFQAEYCAPYAQYVKLLGISPDSVDSVYKIPFLPIELFKSHHIYCAEGEPEKIFTSSNTGGTVASRHPMQSLAHYEQAFTLGFEEFYGDARKWSIYGLLPNYLQREGSSLVYMVDRLIARFGGGFFQTAPSRRALRWQLLASADPAGDIQPPGSAEAPPWQRWQPWRGWD